MARGALAIAQDRWEDVLRHFRRCCDIWVALGGHDAMGMHNVIGAEMHAGLVDDAVRDGEALLAQLQGTREVWRLVWLRVTLTAAWLRKGGLAQARVHAAEAWPQALSNAFDDSMADHCALLAALEGRPRQAARLLGYAEARHAANRDSRQPTEAQSAERALALVRAALGEAEVERLKVAGAALTVEAAAEEALAERDITG
jgi:hypothetical protein